MFRVLTRDFYILFTSLICEWYVAWAGTHKYLNIIFISYIFLLTGIEAGLLTTTMSSSIWMIRIFSDETGTSCLKRQWGGKRKHKCFMTIEGDTISPDTHYEFSWSVYFRVISFELLSLK